MNIMNTIMEDTSQVACKDEILYYLCINEYEERTKFRKISYNGDTA